MSVLVDHLCLFIYRFALQTMQIPECPVCWDHFNDNVHMPRILRCGHTVCQSCLEYLPVDSRLGQQCLYCPECRSPCLWKGVRELPKNFILLRALSNSSQESGGHSRVKLRSVMWSDVSNLFPLSPYLWTDTLRFHRMIRRKLWEAARLSCLAAMLLLLVPLSFVHMLMAWWAATLGFLILVWLSVGGFGLGFFVFCLWCFYNIVYIFSKLNRSLHRKETSH